MSAAHCDRCGAALPESQTRGPRALCPACASQAPPERPRTPSLVLACLLAAGLMGWTAFQIVSLRAAIRGLDRVPAPPPPAAPALTPDQAALLERLAARAPASASEVEVLRRELAEVEALLKRPGGLGALAPLPAPLPPVETVEAPPAPPEPPPPPPPAPPVEDLKSTDPMARYRALAKLERPEQAADAAALLKDEMGFVRGAAAKVLGRLRSPETVPGLLAMVRAEGDLLARRAALEALEAITGAPCLTGGVAGEKEALRRAEAWAAEHKGGSR